MYSEISNNPAEIAAATTRRRPRKADGAATSAARPINRTPAVSPPIDETVADGHAHPYGTAPGFVDPDCTPTYVPTEAVTDLVAQIRNMHKLRQGMIRAKNRIVLQGMACVRHAIHQPEDYENDATKKALRERADKMYREAAADEGHQFHPNIKPYLMAAAPLEEAAETYAKRLEKLAKQLPVFAWVQSVKGLGTVSFATIVGEAGDIGTYRGPEGLWKRMGLAVIGGKAQGRPGAGATSEDWIAHGYSGERRSVAWNARNGLILGMGRWRPAFGEDVDANPELTPYQRLFAKRARLECEKLGKPVTEAKTGKESYSAHAIARAMRFVEKRMLKELYLNWRRASA
jgi:hypothetical protein